MAFIASCVGFAVLLALSLASTTQPTTSEEDKIYELYAELFKTEDEIQSRVNESFQIWPPLYDVMRPTVEEHGCCMSSVNYTVFDELLDEKNELVTLVGLKDRKQWFVHQICSQSDNCTCTCTCATVTQTTAALVCQKGHNCTEPTLASVSLQIVKFPGFCQCFNNV
ncbi:uncharacterized protein LOC131941041 [Physella acuta]|uniref:uncharacterized protein LOC131941041 n=1 Tax=Physella acuta TaxID=109671 RepID=UPI0027DE9F1C|nr:uncharacterized protein LOC131941041 [Physella acuta]